MPPISPRATTITCAALLLLFAIVSYSASLNKSATYDEPLHAAAGYVHLRHGDFRANPEHPPLWKYWAALPWLATPPATMHTDSPVFAEVLTNHDAQWGWSVATLYRTDGNDAGRLINCSRAMMLMTAVALGAIIAVWSSRAGGAVAAIVACALFSLDPNFLAHGSLVANDVAIALLITAVAYVLWLSGSAITPSRAGSLSLLCAAAVCTKFTGILVAPMVLITLCARAIAPAPWPVLSRTLTTRQTRFAAVLMICLSCAITTYLGIWAAYQFRFSPTPNPAAHMDVSNQFRLAAANDYWALHPGQNLPPSLDVSPKGIPAHAAVVALDHHLLPEAFVYGLLDAYHKSLHRKAFLLNTISIQGHWYYFPVAVLTKTPLATLAAFFLLPLALLPWLSTRSSVLSPSPSPNPQSEIRNPQWPWLLTCLATPVLVFGLASLTSNLNIGLRHVLAVYPPVFVAVGLASAKLYSLRPQTTRNVLTVLSVLLAVETLGAFPNYIPFFNYAAGGSRGGLHILSDSNLDWGQDLPALAAWQRAYPDRPLYLAYFGTADPAYYQIQYHNLRGGYDYGPPMEELPERGGVAAISASVLQGIWANPEDTARYAGLFQTRRLIGVLGGSIYLFDLDAPP